MNQQGYNPDAQGLLLPIAQWLAHPELSEIMVNKPYQGFVEIAGCMQSISIPEYSPRLLDNLFQLIANENQQSLSSERPILSGSLSDGSRIQLVLPPVAKYHTFSIRKQAFTDVTLDNIASTNFYNNIDVNESRDDPLVALHNKKQWDQFIRVAIALKKNIVISGATSSGKTTFLNACLQQIDHDERIITLEDTREVYSSHINQVNLLSPRKTYGDSVLSMQDLLQCALRLRPDRIIMGEIRGKEMLDFIAACRTGHEGSLTTIHANSPEVAMMRMMQLIKLNNVPSMRDEDIMRDLTQVIDVIVQLKRTPQGRQLQHVYYKTSASI